MTYNEHGVLKKKKKKALTMDAGRIVEFEFV